VTIERKNNACPRSVSSRGFVQKKKERGGGTEKEGLEKGEGKRKRKKGKKKIPFRMTKQVQRRKKKKKKKKAPLKIQMSKGKKNPHKWADEVGGGGEGGGNLLAKVWEGKGGVKPICFFIFLKRGEKRKKGVLCLSHKGRKRMWTRSVILRSPEGSKTERQGEKGEKKRTQQQTRKRRKLTYRFFWRNLINGIKGGGEKENDLPHSRAGKRNENKIFFLGKKKREEGQVLPAIPKRGGV